MKRVICVLIVLASLFLVSCAGDAPIVNSTPAATVAYNTAIDGGAFNGWGFKDVGGTLKFAQITA